MKASSLLLFIFFSCASDREIYVEAGPGLIKPGVMHCLRGADVRTGTFRYSYVAGKSGHPKNVKILKSPFRDKGINACIKITIREERIPDFNEERTFVEELYFQR